MAFVSGSVNSLADLLAAIQTACQSNGWALNGAVLSKGNAAVQLSIAGNYLQLLGGTGADASHALTVPGPQIAYIGALTMAPLVFPLAYNVHVLTGPDEVYVFVQYSANRWQWLAFGCSPTQGIPGTGGWYAAQCSAGAQTSNNVVLDSLNAGGYSNGALVSGALFAQTNSWINGFLCNSYFHHGLDGGDWSKPDGWAMGTVGSVDAWGVQYPLLARQPNAWNGETALFPIQILARRPSNKASLVGQLGHARYLRNDNLADGDLIVLGADRWKTYPFVQKNAAQRGGGTAPHSGTFGLAVRYDGP